MTQARSVTVPVELIKNNEGIWLSTTSKTGKSSCINIPVLMNRSTGLASRALLEWANEQFDPNEKPFNIDEACDRECVDRLMADPRIKKVVHAALVELDRAERIHPIWPDGTVNQTAIMTGEAGEALKAANHYREGRLTEGRDSMEMLFIELVQTIAMGIRVHINLEGNR